MCTEKFNFKRKVNKNDQVHLTGQTIVREGLARSVRVVGVLEILLGMN